MSANILPTEILLKVFGNLPVSSVLQCRAVCCRWKDLVDDYPRFWRELCEDQFKEQSRDERRKAGLSWLHYYQALKLWPRVDTARVKVYPTDIRTNSFQLLPNGIIGCLKSSEDQNQTPLLKKQDTIVYYDLATFKECNRLCLGLDIKHYTEKLKFIVLVDEERSVHVIPKANNKKFFVGKIQENPSGIRELIVLEYEVFFRNAKLEVVSARLGIVDNEITVETENLGYFYQSIAWATRISNKQVNFLVMCGIFTFKGGVFEKTCELTCFQNVYDNNVNRHLEEHGFKWDQPGVFKNLCLYEVPFEEIPKNICCYKSPALCSYGDIMLVGTARNLLHVFQTHRCDDDRWTPCYGDLEPDQTYKAKIVKTVDIKKVLMNADHTVFYKGSPFHGNIQQVDVVEMVNGHKLIVLYGNTICIVELTDEELKRKIAKTPKPKARKSKKKKHYFY